jgi:pimeloyl-ACP methyl ester carboxylesterase
MDVERLHVSLDDGRSLDVVAAGDEEGTPFVFHHGTPGAAMVFDPFLDEVLARGLRYVAYSRPGYGDSTRRPGRTVADCVEDAVAVLDQLGANRFYTAGWSGGAPHVLACAALLPGRVIAAASVAGPAPVGAEGLDWLAGMGRENVEEFGAAMAGPDELRSYLEKVGPEFASVTGDEMVVALGDLVGQVDREVLTGELGAFLAGNIREALRNGTGGWFDDDLAFVADWGFDVGRPSVPVTVWHGGQDRMAPFSHGQWLATHVPVRARLLPEHGHLSLAVASFPMILDDLMAAERPS